MQKRFEMDMSGDVVAKINLDTEKETSTVIWLKSQEFFDVILPPKYQSYLGLKNFFDTIADDNQPLTYYLESIENNGFFTPIQANLGIKVRDLKDGE